MGRVDYWDELLDDELGEAVEDKRWERRAARREAERARLPKHGRGYAEVTRQMITRRGAAAEGELERARKAAERRKR